MAGSLYSSSEEEIAATALFLASPGAGYITGQELVMDGGYLAVNPSTR
jgi:NAD(P)-dependent dehydrogenase (short-subunit alcohol dehydrogenase family)